MSKKPDDKSASPKHAKGHGRKKKQHRGNAQAAEVATLPVLRPDAAGIDIGTEELWVAVPPDRDAQPVRRFASFTNACKEMVEWIQKCGVKTVAMESTGVVWIPLFQMLADSGLEVCLVNARHFQNVPGKSTDVEDCQWLRFLHSVGLLRSSFRPKEAVCAIRTLVRHREQLVEMRSQHIQHMHKALDQMNVKLHEVISDIVGATGQRIVKAIVAGEQDLNKLVDMRDVRVGATPETIRESLVGNYRREHLFTLKQSLEMYEDYSQKIREVEAQIEVFTAKLEDKVDSQALIAQVVQGKARKPRKCKPERQHLKNMKALCHRKFGVDVCRIPGMQRGGIAEILLGEVGPDLSGFPSSGAFGSWQGVAPNHQISGGKVLSRRTKKLKHPVAEAFRLAAESLEHYDGYLGSWIRGMKSRLGAPKAFTAGAYKLARIFYAMVQKQKEFDESIFQKQEDLQRQRMRRNLEKQAARLGLQLVAIA